MFLDLWWLLTGGIGYLGLVSVSNELVCNANFFCSLFLGFCRFIVKFLYLPEASSKIVYRPLLLYEGKTNKVLQKKHIGWDLLFLAEHMYHESTCFLFFFIFSSSSSFLFFYLICFYFFSVPLFLLCIYTLYKLI